MKGVRTPKKGGRAHGREIGEVLQRYYPYSIYSMKADRDEYFKKTFPGKGLSKLAAQVVIEAKTEDDQEVTIRAATSAVIRRMYDLDIVFRQDAKGKYYLDLPYCGHKSRVIRSPHYMAAHVWARWWHGIATNMRLAYESDEEAVAGFYNCLIKSPAVGWSRTDMFRIMLRTLGVENFKSNVITVMARHSAEQLVAQYSPLTAQEPLEMQEVIQVEPISESTETEAAPALPPPPEIDPKFLEGPSPSDDSRVAIEVIPIALRSNRGNNKMIQSVKVRCTKCGKSQNVYGRGDGSIDRGCVLLREGCEENNFYYKPRE